MTPLPRLLIAATVVGIVAAPALAQAWPAIVVASVPTLAPQSRMVILRADVLGAAANSAARRAATGPALNLHAPGALLTEPNEIVEVYIRAKSEWSDDQGFRVSPTQVAFKQRF